MSVQSGIKVGYDLTECFNEACEPDSKILFIKVQISEDKSGFEVCYRGEKTDSSVNDWNSVQEILEMRQPCYVLFRLEDKEK